MSRLTKGIGTDVETALRMANESSLRAQAAGRDHEQAIRQLRASLTTQEKRSDALHAENLELKKLLENAGENNILQSQAVTLAESKLELEKTVIGLRKEIVDTRDAYLETERRCRALLDESCKRNESMKEDYEGAVARLEREIASLRDSLISIGRENERARDANDGGTIKTSRGDAVLKPEDDPVADMTQQLISNREKIEMLSRQNDRLSKTLCRLREHRGQVTTNGSGK
ncbi:hypothetical protein K0M31_003610 [Melipona bicolor]|uniref:Uncharacterized protein n=1 Tax=Melipona bicolor TaxID=60889 RepID=A0AA40KPP8_9HYME|nr:hypothetical protein K0M31_003610 [Melipona bicolor]